MKSSTCFFSSWELTAKTFRPCLARSAFLDISCTCGSDLRQGGHQVAQKSSTTTLPFWSDSLNGLPSTVSSDTSGAALPSRLDVSASSAARAIDDVDRIAAAITSTSAAAAGTNAYFQAF